MTYPANSGTRLRRLGYMLGVGGVPWKVPDDLLPLYRETWPDLGADVPEPTPWKGFGRPQDQAPEYAPGPITPLETGQRIYPRALQGRLHLTAGLVRLPIAVAAGGVPEYELSWSPSTASEFARAVLRLASMARGQEDS